MYHKSLRAFGLAVSLVVLAGCPSQTQQIAPEPEPPQNLLGSTDELQLVVELSIDLAAKYGGDRVLVALEIDNTLLTMEQENPCSPKPAPGLLEGQNVQPQASAIRPTQADAAEQVRRMQDAGLKVIVLSSREPECRLQAFEELNRNGFSFSSSAWPPQSGYPEAFIPEGGAHPVMYEEGVFLAAGQDKGLMLKALLDKAGDAYPVLIIMVDPKRENLNAVMKVFSFSGTKVHAWRYTREVP